MYRVRTRMPYAQGALAELYKTPHDHTRWADHIARVEKTIEVGKQLLDRGALSFQVADLSCGDAKIALELNALSAVDTYPILGDFAPGYELQGPIEETIEQIPNVDLFICSETIEHLVQPDDVLRQIREKSSKLLLSTPNCSWPDPNPEHLWAWDNEAVQSMLIDAGWNPRFYEESLYIQPDGQPLGYRYQIFGCN